MAIKVSTNEFLNLLLAFRMQILEFVHCLEFYDVQAVWGDAVRFPFEKHLTLVASDVAHGCENICTVRR